MFHIYRNGSEQIGADRLATEAVLAEAPQEAAAIKNPNEGMDIVEGRLMDDCGPSITACGKLDSIKIEYRAGSTQFVINNVTEETVTVNLPKTPIWRAKISHTADTQARNHDKNRLGG